ncbi:MAG: hypothetical protein U0V70_04020 [Terriglobia bacterium]
MRRFCGSQLWVLIPVIFLIFSAGRINATPHGCCAHRDYGCCAQPDCGNKGGCQHDCVAAGALETKWTPSHIEGKVVGIELSERCPTSVIKVLTQDGKTISILTAPSWYLEDRGFEPKVGEILSADVASIDCPRGGHQVALTLKIADGKTFRVRDENGIPLWRRSAAHGCCPH